MINVSTATKNAYLADSGDKQLTIVFPDLDITLTNSDLKQEEFELQQGVIPGDNIEFVGCMSSVLQFTATTITQDIKDAYLEVYITCNNTDSICIFYGYVDDVKQEPHKKEKKITAYDTLYARTSQVNVADWYKTLSFPITVKDFRDSLFTFLNIAQEPAALIADNLSFERQYNPDKLSGLDVIKSICQINAVFGRISKNGTFEYASVPQDTSVVDQAVDYYKTADYKEYIVKPVDKVTLRVDDKDYSYGSGENEYVISNNFFTADLTETVLLDLAQGIYNLIHNFSFQPFECDINALPYLECLDVISLPVKNLATDIPVITPFIILERTFKGIQAMRDNMLAEGDEYQHVFESNLQIDIEELEKALEVIKEELDDVRIKYYLLTNTSDIYVNDGEEKTIINLRFQAKAKTIAVFHAEILVDAETTVSGKDFYAANGLFKYFWRENEVADYKPHEVWYDGDHIVHLLYYLNIVDSTMNHFEVKLNMSGGGVHIRTTGLRGCVYGQNLYATDNFDGVITIHESLASILPAIVSDVQVSNNMGELLAVNEVQSITSQMSDNMSNVTFTIQDITFTNTAGEIMEVTLE